MKIPPTDPTGKDAPTPEATIEFLTGLLTTLEPREHWSTASKSLVMRLRGIYAVGPNADQMTKDDAPEFGWRKFDNMPPIQFEAAQRISELEDRILELELEVMRLDANSSLHSV